MTAVASKSVISPAFSGAARQRINKAIREKRLFVPRSYQADRLASKSRFNLDLWARQTGKSHTGAMDAVHQSLETSRDVMVLSASQDLTREFMFKVGNYAEIVAGVAGEIRAALAGPPAAPSPAPAAKGGA